MKLPPQAQVARWAVKYGPLVLPYVRRLYEQGRWRQLAILHARTLEDGAFSWEMVASGDRVWVVWTGDEVVATYPEQPALAGGTADEVFPGAREDRRQDPDDVTVRRVRRTVGDTASRVRDRLRRSDDDRTDAAGDDDGG